MIDVPMRRRDLSRMSKVALLLNPAEPLRAGLPVRADEVIE